MEHDTPDETRLALSTALGHMVTRYVVIAEIIDPETGEPQLLNAHTPRLPVWDTLGMLSFARRFYDRLVEAPDWEDDE